MQTTTAYTTKRKICLGVDPGIASTRWGIVNRKPTGFQLIGSGVFYTKAVRPIGTRLENHYNAFHLLLTEHAPTLVCSEGVFFNRNISSCISTETSVIAIIELACIQRGIPPYR